MNSYSTYTDENLFALVQKGDNRAFDTLYGRFFPILYVHAFQKLGDSQDAKDIVQDTFMTLFYKKEEIGTIKNFSGYLYTLLKNKTLNLLEKKHVRRTYLDSLPSNEAHTATESYIFEKELRSQIEEGVNLLPEKMRTVFEMSRFKHLSHKEIGDQLDISDKTVKRQIVNALKIIKSKLHLLFF